MEVFEVWLEKEMGSLEPLTVSQKGSGEPAGFPEIYLDTDKAQHAVK